MQGRDPTTHYKEVPSLRYVRCHPSFQGGRRISTSMKPPEYPFAGHDLVNIIIHQCLDHTTYPTGFQQGPFNWLYQSFYMISLKFGFILNIPHLILFVVSKPSTACKMSYWWHVSINSWCWLSFCMIIGIVDTSCKTDSLVILFYKWALHNTLPFWKD